MLGTNQQSIKKYQYKPTPIMVDRTFLDMAALNADTEPFLGTTVNYEMPINSSSEDPIGEAVHLITNQFKAISAQYRENGFRSTPVVAIARESTQRGAIPVMNEAFDQQVIDTMTNQLNNALAKTMQDNAVAVGTSHAITAQKMVSAIVAQANTATANLNLPQNMPITLYLPRKMATFLRGQLVGSTEQLWFNMLFRQADNPLMIITHDLDSQSVYFMVDQFIFSTYRAEAFVEKTTEIGLDRVRYYSYVLPALDIRNNEKGDVLGVLTFTGNLPFAGQNQPTQQPQSRNATVPDQINLTELQTELAEAKAQKEQATLALEAERVKANTLQAKLNQNKKDRELALEAELAEVKAKLASMVSTHSTDGN